MTQLVSYNLVEGSHYFLPQQFQATTTLKITSNKLVKRVAS